MARSEFQAGDWVVYTKQKASQEPGKRAQEITPAAHGDLYTYVVDKHWVVTEVRGNEVHLKTRRGKLHVVASDDPMLRKANFLERLLWRSRFQQVEQSQTGG